MQTEAYLKRMFEFVQKAGELSLVFRQESGASLKPDRTVVTKADKAISALCRQMLSDFIDQGHMLIDEEDPQMPFYLNQDLLNKTQFIWSVDPIDGTRLYANQMPSFGISLGLLKDLKPWLGVVYFPVLNELFFSDGQYAYFVANAFTDHEARQLIVPIDQEINAQSLFFCNDTFFEKFNWADKDFHIMIHACAVVNLCWPAIGRGVGCFLKCHIWDIAGSWPIVKAAGMEFRSVKDGQVMDCLHEKFYDKDKKVWEMKEYYLISSKRNYDVIKNKIRIGHCESKGLSNPN